MRHDADIERGRSAGGITHVPATGVEAPCNLHMLERFDRQLLTFVVNWAPFGGPPVDECFVEFGMDIDRVRERCAKVVGNSPAGYYSQADCQLLVRASELLQAGLFHS